MTRKWAYIIIITVVVVVFLSGFEVYKAFREDKDIGEYQKYSTSISREYDIELLNKIYNMQDLVLVKDEDIAPETVTEE